MNLWQYALLSVVFVSFVVYVSSVLAKAFRKGQRGMREARADCDSNGMGTVIDPNATDEILTLREVDPNATDEILTVREVVELLTIAPRTVRQMALAGKIPSVRAGGQLRFRREEINRVARIRHAIDGAYLVATPVEWQELESLYRHRPATGRPEDFDALDALVKTIMSRHAACRHRS
jgi:excisionase family DNA binding protein